MKKIFLITLLFIMLFCSSCRKNNSDPIAHTDKLERNEQVLENNQPENNISVNEQTGDEQASENNETTQENQSEPVIEKAEFYPYKKDFREEVFFVIRLQGVLTQGLQDAYSVPF